MAAPWSCPSAQPDMAGAVAFGVISGSVDRPLVQYLPRSVPVGEVMDQLGDAPPGEVLRIGARCEEAACVHNTADQCSLGHRIATVLPAVVQQLPRCTLRSTCRWFDEQGGAACLRCPQILTNDRPRPGNDLVAEVARPTPSP